MKAKSRQYKLIKMLCQNREYKPMSYYANNLNVTPRTISNDLKMINKMLSTYHLDLIRRPNYGILLKGNDINVKRLMINCERLIPTDIIFDEYSRHADILKITVLNEEKITYESLAYRLNTSTSTIVKDMKKLKKYMNEDCKITSNQTGTVVIGTEFGIQRLLKSFFNNYMKHCNSEFSTDQLMGILSNYYPADVVKSVKKALDFFQDIFGKKIEDYYLNSLFIFLVTFTSRKKKGKIFEVDYPLPNSESLELLINYYLAVEISDYFNGQLGVQFNKTEIEYISYQLFMHKVEMNINNKYLETIFEMPIKYFINEISKFVGANLNNDKKLFDALICHMIPMIYRIKSNIAIENPILDNVKNNYPVLFNLAWFYLNEFARKFDIEFTEHEISFIIIHIQVAIERVSASGQLVIVCETGLISSELLISRIRGNMPASVELRALPLSKVNAKEVETADLIISTVTLKKMDIPYIKVSPVITDEELKEIYYKYLKKIEGKVFKINYQKNMKMNFFTKITPVESIHLSEKLFNKDQCIAHLVNNLVTTNRVNDKFLADVFDREELGSTYVSPGVSFPHAMTENVIESSLSILIFPKGVFWDGNIINIVLLFAINESDKELFLKELPLLYRKVLNKSFIKEITKMNSAIQVWEKLLF